MSYILSGCKDAKMVGDLIALFSDTLDTDLWPLVYFVRLPIPKPSLVSFSITIIPPSTCKVEARHAVVDK